MKVIEEITKEEVPFDKVRVTEDGKYVYTETYNKACDILHEGLLDSKQIKEAIVDYESLLIKVSQFLLKVRKLGTRDSKSPYVILSDVIKMEQGYCENVLGKDKSCITQEEQSEVLDWIEVSTDLKDMQYGYESDFHHTPERMYDMLLASKSWYTS